MCMNVPDLYHLSKSWLLDKKIKKKSTNDLTLQFELVEINPALHVSGCFMLAIFL